MQEKFSLDNENIDGVVNTSETRIMDVKEVKDESYRVKDNIDVIMGNMKEKEGEKKKLDEKLEKDMKEFKESLKKERRRKRWLGLWNFFTSLFIPDTYVKVIQSFEDLLFVVFVDFVLLSVLLSIAYMSYIIIKAEDIDNLKLMGFKFVGALCICIISIIIQVNLDQRSRNSKDGEE